jgi:hypothetical protein
MERLKLNQCGLIKLKRKILRPRKIQNKSIVATNKFKKIQISRGGAEIKSRGHNRAEENKFI